MYFLFNNTRYPLRQLVQLQLRLINNSNKCSIAYLRDKNPSLVDNRQGAQTSFLIKKTMIESWRYIVCACSSVVERVTDNDEVHGSIPCTRTKQETKNVRSQYKEGCDAENAVMLHVYVHHDE